MRHALFGCAVILGAHGLGCSDGGGGSDENSNGVSGASGASGSSGSAGAGGGTVGSGGTGSGGTAGSAGTGGNPYTNEYGCVVDTGYAGDDKCLKAPDPSVGFQVHYGPRNYDDPNDVNRF